MAVFGLQEKREQCSTELQPPAASLTWARTCTRLTNHSKPHLHSELPHLRQNMHRSAATAASAAVCKLVRRRLVLLVGPAGVER